MYMLLYFKSKKIQIDLQTGKDYHLDYETFYPSINYQSKMTQVRPWKYYNVKRIFRGQCNGSSFSILDFIYHASELQAAHMNIAI